MKKLILVCTVVLGALFTVSCEGPRGPQGPPGGNEFPYVMDIRLSFDKNLEATMATNVVANPIELFLGDVVLIYIKEGETKRGEPIWAPLPIRYFVQDAETKKDEELEYTFNFSPDDIEIIASATLPLDFFANAEGPNGRINYVRNREFRVVYVPGLNPEKKNTVNAVQNEVKSLSYDEAVVKYNLQKAEVHKKY